jgi:tetratricopeptide (TPR) repeat protein
MTVLAGFAWGTPDRIRAETAPATISSLHKGLAAETRYIRSHPKQARGYLRRAEHHLRLAQGRDRIPHLHAAVEDLESAARLAPSDAAVHLKLGSLAYGLDEHQTAVHHHTQALWLSPHLAESYMGRGFALLSLGLIQRAQGDFRQAIRFNKALRERIAAESASIRAKQEARRAVMGFMSRLARQNSRLDRWEDCRSGIEPCPGGFYITSSTRIDLP